MIYKSQRLFVTCALLFVAGFIVSPSPAYSQNKNEKPVDLQADKLVHDNKTQIVTASGNVVLRQEGRVIKADKISYDLRNDEVSASGNVEFIDINGDKHYADSAKFNNELKNGFVEGLQAFLLDGSRFTASKGEYIDGNKTTMKNASYTPCETCKDNPGKPPLWRIRASEVEHDKKNKKVSYKNARFELKGVPVAYVPYFSHPDGSVERKSGFLTPSAGYQSDLGAFVQSDYYWSISEHKDLTLGVMAMTGEAPLAKAQWRQRWSDASLTANGSFTYSSRNDNNGIVRDEKLRGNLSMDGLWDINEKWRSGLLLDVVSDDQYLRQYNFSNEYVLKNELYIERFSGRNYGSGRILAFQDLRTDENRQDQPHVLPEIQASFIGEPGSMPLTGGRWDAQISLLGLVRDNGEQDMNRAHSSIGWQKRIISDYGLVSVLDAKLQGTLYSVNDRDGSKDNTSINGNSIETRGFGYINVNTSYPLLKEFENSQMLLEPVASVTIAPNLGANSEIPNEDSQDVQIDSLNLFEANRFPGIDGVEDRTHITYGIRSGLYGHDGSYGKIFVGQSYRVDDDSPFLKGSGLETRSSDIVGQISAGYKENYKLDYSFQLDNDNLASQRHELDASANINGLDLSMRYLFAKALDGTDIDETREQIRNSASYYINDNWRIFGSTQHDLGRDSGLRKANFGIDYIGQCISLSMIGQRNLTDKSSGYSGTEIMFRIGLKNLGEFETSKVKIGSNEE